MEKDFDAWYEMYQKYWKEFPKLHIIPYEDSWFFRQLMKLGWRMGATTIWNTVYMDKEYIETQRGIDIMAHEIVHIRDQHKWHILFFLSYFMLPIGPSFKAYWEWRAYQQDLAIIWHQYKRQGEYGLKIIEYYKGFVANQFIYQNYAWMLPFPKLVHGMIERFMKTLP